MAALTGATVTETAASQPEAVPCAAKWRAVQRVAVRRPGPYAGPVATLRSPVHH
ncbi:hypothetical protein [Streptomyces sp. NPDC050535]|uniref:hypothetical protein n=1 Tax=Streptomyces sp. NPDC050535 TaxID=3365626 RepID=UPI0037BD0169